MKIKYLIIGILILISSCQHKEAINEDFMESKVIEYTIHSEVLNDDRSHIVYSPATAKDKSLPVLFILDGSNYFSFFKALTEQWSSKKEMVLPEMIIVAIKQKNRSSELLHSYIQEDGKGELFLDYIERELIPSIDSTCNTYPHRTLFGHSRGGLFALNVLVDKPTLFDNYLVSDPNLTLGNLAFLKKWKGSDVNLNINKNSLFIGLADTKEGNTLEEVLNPDSNIYPHMRTIWAICEEIENNKSNDDYFDWKYYDGFGHKTIPPMVAMDGLLSVFEYHRFDKYALIYSHIDNKITYDQFKQSINDHFDIISKRFGSTVLPYEHLIFDYGEVFLKEGMADKAVDMFKWNIKNFPESVQSKEKLKSINDTQQSI